MTKQAHNETLGDTSQALIARPLRASRSLASPKAICYHKDGRDRDPQTLHECPLINPVLQKMSPVPPNFGGPGESAGAHVRFGGTGR